MKTFWLSFAPEDGSAARVYVLDAQDEIFARQEVHRRKLYRPGDQVLVIEIPPTEVEFVLPRDRWLTEKELAAVGAETLETETSWD